MSEIHLSDAQQQQLARLTTALGQNAELRARFQSDVREVFSAYGLGELLPADTQFEARLAEGEVSGFALRTAGHADTGHWDFAHADTHLDTVVPVIGNYQIVPRLGPLG